MDSNDYRDTEDLRATRDEARRGLEEALYELKRVIVGHDAMLERMIVALLARGHVLLHGVPLLADEINRAPAKVQSALVHVTQEQQDAIGCETFPVQSPFLGFDPQKPIE